MLLLNIIGLLIIGSIVLAGLGYLHNSRRENAALKHVPLAAIERSGDVYKIAQQDTRLLERLLEDDMVRCTIPEQTQKRIQNAIDAFYDL